MAEEIRVVIFGKTGVGKSSLGNNLLGKDIFSAHFGAQSSSDKTPTREERMIDEHYKLVLVDTPGLFDTGSDNMETAEILLRTINATKPGPHIFMFVLSIGRFTAEERSTVEILKDLFGIYSTDYLIIVFTRKDTLDHHKTNLETFIDTAGDDLKSIVSQCQGKMTINNRASGEELSESVDSLLQMIKGVYLQNEKKHYTDELLAEAKKQFGEKLRKQEEEDHKRERELEDENKIIKVLQNKAEAKIKELSEIIRVKDNVDNTKQCLQKIIKNRIKLLKIVSEERSELDKLASDVQICKISGGVAGTVGTGLVISGFVASFFTCGASLILSGIGAAIGASGAVVSSSSAIADALTINKKKKRINDLLSKDAKHLKKFESSYDDLKLSVDVLPFAANMTLATKTIVTNIIRVATIADIAVDVTQTAFGALRGAAKFFSIAGAVFSVISLPFDIHMVVTNSIAKHKGDKHRISEDLKKFENNIQEELVQMEASVVELENIGRTIESL